MKNYLTLACLAVFFSAASATAQVTHVIFVMTDGLRWQEVFQGANASILEKEKEKGKTFWHETAVERREALMPFLWSEIAKNGQIFGNREKQSEAFVTNGLNFSYPGYSETLCGFPDPRIASNDKIPNPNVTVLEWLNEKAAYREKIAAFGAWDVFPFIFNAARSTLPVNAGYDPLTTIPATPSLDLLNRLKAELPHVWPDEPFDSFPFNTALEYLRVRKPKILFLSLGETDEWAHAGNYTEYLNAAHRADSYLKELWQTAQSIPEYRGQTVLIFSPDHGRGDNPQSWKDHGQKVPESKYIWMAFLGPGISALGERSHIPPVTQNQIAATLAALLGENYSDAVPNAGKPITDLLQR